MASPQRKPNPERLLVVRLVKTWLKRAHIRVDQVIARMQTFGCDLSRADFENHFTRLDRNPTLAPMNVLALIAALTEGLPERGRCKAGEALEFARLTRLPFDQLANLEQYFPPAEFQTAYLSYALPQTSAIRLTRALTRATYTLSAPLTNFIGRERELAMLEQTLTDPTAPRLIVLTGAGGCGKTRLALQAAADLRDHFPNGVYMLSLAAVRAPAMVVPTIAQALDLQETSGKDLATDLEKYLHDRQLLIVLDNLDQVVVAAPALTDLLRAAPGLKILATSRIALDLSAEYSLAVPPLDLPDPRHLPPLDQLRRYSAIALFVTRARAASPHFELTAHNAPTVIAICARLGGMPLALELAAARVKTMPLKLLHDQLQRAMLHVLTNGARDVAERHQTMRDTIAWSYERLTPAEQKLFTRLAVFEGGCSVEAALAVIADDTQPETTLRVMDGIASLVRQSLVVRYDGGGAFRFALLEPLREFAREQLGTSEMFAQRHATYYRAFAQRAAAHFRGAEQKTWLDRIEEENANLRAALDWLRARGDGDAFMELAGALELFWYWRGYWSQARQCLEELLATPITLSLAARAKAHDELGGFLWAQGDLAQAEKYVAASLADWRACGNRIGLAETLNTAGLIAEAQANYHQAAEFFREGLALRREQADAAGIALMLNNLAGALIHLAEFSQATALCEESFAQARALGHRRLMGAALFDLGVIAERQADYPCAAQRFRDALTLFDQFGDARRSVGCIERLARVQSAQDRALEAARLFGAAEALRERIGFPIAPSSAAEYAQAVAAVRAQCGDAEFARAWVEGRAWTVAQLLMHNPDSGPRSRL